MRFRRLGGPLLLLTLTALGNGCASRPGTEPRPAASATTIERGAGFEDRALLLMLEDRRLYEPRSLEAMLGGTVETRRALATALGRIGDPRGRSLLQGLLVDTDSEVRRAAAFALGELGSSDATRALIVAAVDDDSEVGSLAVEALGKIGAPLADVRRALGAIDAGEAWRRLAPFLFRFHEDGVVEAAVEGLKSDDPEVHRGAAYALGRDARPGGRTALLGLLADPDPFVRAIAARGVGQVGGIEDLPRLLPLIDETAISPRVQALRAAAAILGRVEALPPLDWGRALARLADDPEPSVRAAMLAAAGAFLPNPELEAVLRWRLDNGDGPRERELAFTALVAGKVEDRGRLIDEQASSGDRNLRAAAATAAGKLGDRDLLTRLAADAEPVVRVAAVAALAAAGETTSVLGALDDPDPTVRATALDALAEAPELPSARIAALMDGARADGAQNDVRRTGIAVLTGRAEKHPESERAPVIETLEKLTEDPDWLIRRDAADALVKLGQPRPEIGPVDTGRGLEAYRQVLIQTDRPRRVEIETERGRLGLELACPQAPMTCLSFLQLAAQSYFDGTRFHRVVPDFVVQGGDPRGDGWGGPGYSLRDEINRLRYVRGAVGMALSGPDTGGSQFFIALSPQPHLDGGYTVFGRVTAGDAVLDRIRQGDRILSVRVLPEPAAERVR